MKIPLESPKSTLHNSLIHKIDIPELDDIEEIKVVDYDTGLESSKEQIYKDVYHLLGC